MCDTEFAEPFDGLNHVVGTGRVESDAMGTQVVVCEAFPRAFLALVFPLAVENSVFIQCHLARVFLVAFGAFVRFRKVFNLIFFKAVRPQVPRTQVLDLLSQYVATEGTELTTHGFFRQVVQFVKFELNSVLEYLAAIFAHE